MRDYFDLPDSSPLFAFGHGLSYTTFELGDVQLSPAAVRPGERVRLSALEYWDTRRWRRPAELRHGPLRNGDPPCVPTRRFRRVTLGEGETKRVTFKVDTSQFALCDRQGRWIIEPGTIDLLVAFSPEDGASETLTLDGPPQTPPFRSAFYATSSVEPG